MFIPALLLTLPLPAEDVATRLAELAAPSLERRQAAERWLAGNLKLSDLALVADSLQGGSAEIGRRLVTLLGGRDRHLGLAALLATDGHPATRAVGESALLEMIVRWDPGALDAPLAPRTLPDPWTRIVSRSAILGGRDDSLTQLVDRLERLVPGPAPLVIDPTLLTSGYLRPPRASGLPIEGAWGDWIRGAARAWRISFEVHAWRDSLDNEGPAASPWIRLCKRGMEGEGNSASHLVSWVRGVLREHDPATNVACAQALAAVGWPAGLDWLEQRWIESSDQAALQGVLSAAGRGRVVPGLAEAQRVRALLESCDRSLAESKAGCLPRAEALARALAALGPVFRNGQPVSQVLTEGWEQLDSRARWVRLAALEGGHGNRPQAWARAAEVLASDAEPWLAWQSLRTLLALDRRAGGDSRLVLGAASERIAWARKHGRLGALARWMSALAVVPPNAQTLSELLPGRDLDLFLFDVFVHDQKWSLALKRLPSLLARDTDLDRVADRMRSWWGAGEIDLVQGSLARAASAPGIDPARITRLALRAGHLQPQAVRSELERIATLEVLTEGDAADLGELCAHDQLGWRARDALLERLALDSQGNPTTPVDIMVVALRRAWLAMSRTRLDLEAEALMRTVREREAHGRHPASDVLFDGTWPPSVSAEMRDLRDEDPRLGS